MKDPFKRDPSGHPNRYGMSRSILRSNKLKILAAIVTFVLLTIFVSGPPIRSCKTDFHEGPPNDPIKGCKATPPNP